MTACDNIKALFSEYLDNLISPDQKNMVDSHLSQCPECEKTLQQVEYLSKRMQSVSTVSASANFDQNLRARIINKDKAPARMGSIRNLSYGFSGVAVFAALTFFVMTTINTPGLDSPSNALNGNVQNVEQEILLNKAGSDPILASDIQKNDSLKNAPAHIDQKLQLIDQENK